MEVLGIADQPDSADRPIAERKCSVCGSVDGMKGKRPDARTCSDSCRQRAKAIRDAEKAGFKTVGDKTYPYALLEGVRMNHCAVHDEEYPEYWHDAPFRIWGGSCETCAAEQAVEPLVEAKIAERRFEISREVDSGMEAFASELPAAADRFLSEPIPSDVAMKILNEALNVVRVAGGRAAFNPDVNIMDVLREAAQYDVQNHKRASLRQEIQGRMVQELMAELVAAHKQAKARGRTICPPKLEHKIFSNPAASASYWESEAAKGDPDYPAVKGGL